MNFFSNKTHTQDIYVKQENSVEGLSAISMWWKRWFLTSNAKDIGTLDLIFALFTKIVTEIKFLFKSPPAPGKDMRAIYSAASFKYILVVGGVCFVYTGNGFNFEELLNLFSNITNLLPSSSSYIHINNIPSFTVKIFNPYENMPTYVNSGRDILSNLGNRGFNYHPIMFHISKPLLMPFIGYIVYLFYNFNYSKALSNLFERFNKLSSKNFLLNKFNLLKNTLPSIRDIRVFMYGVQAQNNEGNDGNEGNKKNDSIKQDKQNKMTFSEWLKLIRELTSVVTDMEGLVYSFTNYLQVANITYIVGGNGFSCIESPATMSDDDTSTAGSILESWDNSIRDRSDRVGVLTRQIAELEDILTRNNVAFSNDSLQNLRQRALDAINRFMNSVREDS